MFGPVPDDFYGLIGRIALVSTLLEDKIMTMLYSLDTKPHPTYAGLPASRVAPEIRKRLMRRAATLGEALVDEIDDALNRIVHGPRRAARVDPQPVAEPDDGEGPGVAVQAGEGQRARIRDHLDRNE